MKCFEDTINMICCRCFRVFFLVCSKEDGFSFRMSVVMVLWKKHVFDKLQFE